MSTERPIVVAPRPVRLGTLFTRKQDSEFSFIADITTDPPDRASRPPSAAALPPEALDEFLSILRPSFLRKPRSVTFPSFLTDRPIALRQLPRVDSRADKVAYDLCAAVADDSTLMNASLTQVDDYADLRVIQPEPDARQWFSSTLLASPISRFHTRNPFQRNREGSPAPTSPLNPASVPLPTPSPTEFLENI